MTRPFRTLGPGADHSSPEDRELIACVARGDRRAFEALYRRYYPRLFGYLLRLVGSRELAEEVLDDTMVVVWQSAGRFEGRSKGSTWIFGIAYRRALKRLRRRLRAPASRVSDHVLADLAAPESPERDLDRKEQREAVLLALAELPVQQRAVVLLTYFEDLPYAEIASILDCPVNTVKTRMFHARRRLRAVMEEDRR
ncbi:MAG TPA: sigma-70 family RNA polymerase sigma factor [Thermoanaerobaculia bacterium]|nr:sigma-70 family RNA polymerase sigma factor [Thermoanaerobaculia bacterium]